MQPPSSLFWCCGSPMVSLHSAAPHLVTSPPLGPVAWTSCWRSWAAGRGQLVQLSLHSALPQQDVCAADLGMQQRPCDGDCLLELPPSCSAGLPKYNEQVKVVVISDVGANFQAVFIPLGTLTAIFFFASLWLDFSLHVKSAPPVAGILVSFQVVEVTCAPYQLAPRMLPKSPHRTHGCSMHVLLCPEPAPSRCMRAG